MKRSLVIPDRSKDIKSIWTGQDLLLLDSSLDSKQSYSSSPLHISPALKMLIFGDGSPTRLLTILTGSRVIVKNVTHTDISSQLLNEPDSEIPNGYADDIPRQTILSLFTENESEYEYEKNNKLNKSGENRERIDRGEGGEGDFNGEGYGNSNTRLINPIIRRSVLLCNENDDCLGIGISWWRQSDLDTTLPGDEKTKPIGGALMSNRLGVHRELIAVVRGRNKEVEEVLNCERNSQHNYSTTLSTLFMSSESTEIPLAIEKTLVKERIEVEDELWGRFYVMWKEGKRLTVVYEVFSTKGFQRVEER
jgi:chorismate-pyruvate lyase